jgi:hypothetical protein
MPRLARLISCYCVQVRKVEISLNKHLMLWEYCPRRYRACVGRENKLDARKKSESGLHDTNIRRQKRVLKNSTMTIFV